jgi:hypothetical protein
MVISSNAEKVEGAEPKKKIIKSERIQIWGTTCTCGASCQTNEKRAKELWGKLHKKICPLVKNGATLIENPIQYSRYIADK